jgi:hypothetical protein
MNTAIRLAALGGIALLLTGCFEKDPVTERLFITIFGDGTARVRSVVDVASVSEEKEHAVVRERARHTRSLLENGHDEWSRRYAGVRAIEEQVSFRRTNGELTSVERWATLREREFGRFFADTALSFQFVEGRDSVELHVYAGRPTAASAAQRRFVRDSLEGLAASLAAHYRSAADLYSYLDAHPERAAPVFAHLLDPAREAALEEEEETLIESFGASADAVTRIRFVDEGSDVSLDRASRLVYDPFPADLTIHLPGEIVEAEGFVRRDSRVVTVPRIALADAVVNLRGLWVEPDLLALVFEQEIATDEPAELDAAALADAPRRASRPSAADVRSALERSLAAPGHYRVRWRRPTDEEREVIRRRTEEGRAGS